MRSHPTRRSVLGAGLALPLVPNLTAASSAVAPTAARTDKKILVMGGTRFLGPAIVDAARERGYEVTLFNRGKSNSHLYPDLEKLRGDRDTGDLKALEGRAWDMVIDTSLYLPSHARDVAQIVADHCEHYVNISTCSVYDTNTGEKSFDEASPVGRITKEQIDAVTKIGDVYRVGQGAYYGPLKALCEEELERAMPGRVTSLRPGVIAGKDDPSDRLPYWVVRVGQGGEVLLPAPDCPLQFTDVRDLGIMSVEFGAARKAGIYNSIGFPGVVTLAEVAHGVKIVLGSDATFTSVDESFLLEHQVRPFAELPFWLPADYRHRFENTKGIAAGMRFRPIAETIRATYDWHHEQRGADYEWRWTGMTPERERELLEKWHAREREVEHEKDD